MMNVEREDSVLNDRAACTRFAKKVSNEIGGRAGESIGVPLEQFIISIHGLAYVDSVGLIYRHSLYSDSPSDLKFYLVWKDPIKLRSEEQMIQMNKVKDGFLQLADSVTRDILLLLDFVDPRSFSSDAQFLTFLTDTVNLDPESRIIGPRRLRS